MLRTRVITALILLAAFLIVLSSPAPQVFYAFCGLALTIAAWEWCGLAGIGNRSVKLILTLISAIALFAAYAVLPFTQSMLMGAKANWLEPVLYSVLIIWPLFFVCVVAYPRLGSLWSHSLTKLLLGLLVIAQAWASVIWIRQHEYFHFLIVFAIALVALSDIGAYFAGRRFGKRKLAPRVSPGKSWEGVIGGMLAALLLSVVSYLLFNDTVFSGISLFSMLLIAVVVSLVSVLGDLSISMLKRAAGLKDSGQILPGHGGVLDRIDGMLAALPVFVFLNVAA